MIVALAGAAGYAIAARILGVPAASKALLVVSAFALGLRHPLAAVAVMLALSPLEFAGQLDHGLPWLTASRLAIAGATVSVLASRWAVRKPLEVPRMFWMLVAFAASSLVGSLLYGMDTPAVIDLVAIVIQLVMCVTVYNVARDARNVRVLLWAIALGSVPVLAAGVMDELLGRSFLGSAGEYFAGAASPVLWRITSTFTTTNGLGRYAVFALAATVGLMAVSKGRGRAVLAVLAAGQAACGLATLSRSAMIGTVVVLGAAVAFLVPARSWRRALSLPPLRVAAAVLALAALVVVVRPVFENTRLASSDDSGRFALWRASAQAVDERPVFGYGVGNTAKAVAAQRYRLQRPHNLALEALLASGFIGAVLFLGYLVWTFLRLFRLRKDDPSGMAAVGILLLLSVFVAGMFMHALLSDEIWIAIALTAAMRRWPDAQAPVSPA